MVIKMAEFPQEGSRYSKRSRMAEDRRRREGPEGQMQAAMPKFADGLRQRDLQMETHPRRTLSGRLVLAWAEVSDFKLDLMLHPVISRDLDKSRAEFALRLPRLPKPSHREQEVCIHCIR
ncbi:hypothetical protein BDV41DRAFT_517557 [Aspergillus transmontanensis]|uniref:Uncharacterized protein n=1 Tax=Aspergillus transmontanensis TaxID=1034304 RepID=A0A5N6WHN0_9EURO|nr:hypothetical protein BDV41DRAFT_517557 [Aspergillus transmontanensis]